MLAGGIYFEKHIFSASTRMFIVPFFHLLLHTHIRFGNNFPPEIPSLILAYRLQHVYFYGVSSSRNLLVQNRNLLCKVTFLEKSGYGYHSRKKPNHSTQLHWKIQGLYLSMSIIRFHATPTLLRVHCRLHPI